MELRDYPQVRWPSEIVKQHNLAFWLMGLDSIRTHISDGDKPFVSRDLFGIAAAHVIEESLREILWLAFGIHVFDVPELIGVALHHIVTRSVTINRDQIHTGLALHRTDSGIADRAICLSNI